MAQLGTLPPVYPILDTDSLARLGCGVGEAARALINGGARILQFRHKTHWTAEAVEEALALSHLCREQNVLLVINDRADYAALAGAGLHLGQEDLTPGEARLVVGKDAVVGMSTHNLGQLALADQQPADYLAIGPVFTTGSKANPDPVIGLEMVRLARMETRKPLAAIGGITLRHAGAVWAAGADSIAVISALLPQDVGAGDSAAAIERNMRHWLRESQSGS